MEEKLYAVLTTINAPNACVRGLSKTLGAVGAEMIVIGDAKGPESFELDGALFFPLNEQIDMGFSLTPLLPLGHYARKNLGYLQAMRLGATIIYETDDDNLPAENWDPFPQKITARRCHSNGWVNVYSYFTSALIWPRGLPLTAVQQILPSLESKPASVDVPVLQGLVNRSPDVDAIWRLVLDHDFIFDPGLPVWLGPGAWCPFNSQNTWWRPEAFVLMYIPSFCPFRMCDIWRGFVAQRCLWAMGKGITFLPANAVQDRNVHNLQNDFNDEVAGYTQNATIASILDGLDLGDKPNDASGNLLLCYEALVKHGIFPENELELVRTWCTDFGNISGYEGDHEEQ